VSSLIAGVSGYFDQLMFKSDSEYALCDVSVTFDDFDNDRGSVESGRLVST